MVGRREHVLALRHQPGLGDLPRHLGRRQDPAVARLGPLGDLDLDHLDLGHDRPLGERVRVEVAVLASGIRSSRSRSARSDRRRSRGGTGRCCPRRCRARSRPAFAPWFIARMRLRPERAEAHRGDVEHRRRVRLGAVRPADAHAQVALGVLPPSDAARSSGRAMSSPASYTSLLGAERLLVLHVLRALVDHRAGVAIERAAVRRRSRRSTGGARGPSPRAGTACGRHRVVPQDAVALLEYVLEPEQGQGHEEHLRSHHRADETASGTTSTADDDRQRPWCVRSS